MRAVIYPLPRVGKGVGGLVRSTLQLLLLLLVARSRTLPLRNGKITG